MGLFRREASVLRTVRDDAIVGYDGVLRDEEGRVYLVMEFVDGPSLTSFVEDRVLTLEDVRRLRDRLARGLAAAHDKGVIHRDMSPDPEIGRASCRERVCQYVSSSVVAVSVK